MQQMTATKRTRLKRRTRAIRSGAVMMGTLAVTATVGPRQAAAASTGAPDARYQKLMADILRTSRKVPQSQTPTAPPRTPLRFDIAPGPLAGALASFERVTGISVEVAIAALNEIHSEGVTGVFTPTQALQNLLSGAGLAYRFTGPNTVRIDVPGQTEFVSVTSSLPPTVSSPKATAPLLDTPQSVAVIPSQVFNQQGAQNLTEVLRNTPGITFNAGENGFASGMANFSLRGFDTAGSIFVDNARDSGNFFRDVFNVENVEVVKGPAGDNGRGTAGGYVNLATKGPRAESFQRGSLTYGIDEYSSKNRTRASVDLNEQINAGTAFRLNALWQGGGVPTRASAERNNWGFAPSVAFGLDGSTRLLLSYQRVVQNDLPDWGTPGALFEGMNQFNPAAGGSANRDRFYGHASDYDDVTADAVLARVEHHFTPSVRLSNQVRWSDSTREALYAIPTGFTPATRVAVTQRQGYSRENTAVSNLTNLFASFETGALRHALTTGIELSREDSSADRYPTNGILGNPGSTSIESPDPNRALVGLAGLVPIQTAAAKIDTVAGYAYDTVHLHPQWQATGGLRVERYHVTLDSRTAAGAPQGPDAYDRTDTVLSGKVGIVYKPSPESSVYGAVGVAALPPGSYLSNPDISRDGDNAFPGWNAGQNSLTSKVQSSLNYEVGTKWDVFDERLNVQAAVFRTERRNLAMAGTVNGVPNTFVDYARQVVQGVEVGAAGNVTPDWSLFGGILFMNSERQHSAAVDAARLAENPADYGARTSTNGDELAFTPKVSANLWTTYRLPLGLTLGGGLQQVGDSWLGRPDNAERIIPNGNAGKLPGRTVFNALATYDINRQFTLRLNIDNLTNAFYPVSANWGGSRVFPGPARSFLLSTDLRF